MKEQYKQEKNKGAQKQILTYCLVIGAGAAGLSSGISFLKNFHQSKKQNIISCLCVSPRYSNSAISPWNLFKYNKQKIHDVIWFAGNKMSDPKLLNVFIKNYTYVFHILKSMGVPLKNSNIGKVPLLRGAQILKIFENKFLEAGGVMKEGVVTNFLLDNNKEIRGVSANINGKKVQIIANQIIIAGGGLTNLYEFATGYSNLSIPNILALSIDAGIDTKHLEFNMFHLFLIIDNRLPKTLISGDLLQKATYLNEKGEEFLSEKVADALRNNKFHYIFPEMTREFYLQSCKSRIYMDISSLSEKEFENYKKENEFGWIFTNKKLSEVKRFEIHPAFHYSIGGIKINSKAQTNKKNVYAAGEITAGLHGSNRVGGFAISEALIFGKIAGESAALNAKPPKIVETKEVGNSKLTPNIRKNMMAYLGPIKSYKSLTKLQKNLENKAELCSEEKLMLEMVKSSLKRKSVGSHFIVE